MGAVEINFFQHTGGRDPLSFLDCMKQSSLGYNITKEERIVAEVHNLLFTWGNTCCVISSSNVVMMAKSNGGYAAVNKTALLFVASRTAFSTFNMPSGFFMNPILHAKEHTCRKKELGTNHPMELRPTNIGGLLLCGCCSRHLLRLGSILGST